MDLWKGIKNLFSQPESAPAAVAAAPTQEYQGFAISPAPIKNGDLYRVAATISKGERSHQLIRADEMANLQDCIDVSLRKARLMIDQQGDKIFQENH